MTREARMHSLGGMEEGAPSPHPLPPLRWEDAFGPGYVAERGENSKEGGGPLAPRPPSRPRPSPGRPTSTEVLEIAGGGERGGGWVRQVFFRNAPAEVFRR